MPSPGVEKDHVVLLKGIRVMILLHLPASLQDIKEVVHIRQYPVGMNLTAGEQVKITGNHLSPAITVQYLIIHHISPCPWFNSRFFVKKLCRAHSPSNT